LLRTDSAPELFRRNCIATRLLASFAKRYGSEYLRETLQSLLQAIVEQQSNPATKLTFELDPTKAPIDTDASRNAANLRELCQAFLDAITQSSHLVPREFREFCHFLVQAVSARFPGAQTTAVGGFIFLRFFCPAIVAPETHRLVDPIQNKDLRRGLLLATKVIQNLANDVQFGTKEAFMTPLNNFLFTNRHKVSQFFANLARPPTPLPAPSKPVPSKHLDPADIARLHRFVADNLEKIGRDMMSVKQTKGLASPLAATPGEPLGTTTSPADSAVSPDVATAHQLLPSIGTSINNARGPSMDSLGSGSSRVDTDRRAYSVSSPPSSQAPHASMSSSSLAQDSGKLEAVGVDVIPTQPGRTSMELHSAPSTEGANGGGLVLQIQPSSHLSEIERLTKSRKLYDRLCGVVSQLGKPPEVTRSEQVIATAKGSANAEMYREFMRRTSHRNVDPIKAKKLFYQGGLSKEKRSVVYFIARRLIADATDMDLLMLHIFQIMEHVMNKPFDLLLDLTQFGHANEIQSQWIVQFVQLLPAQLTQNLHTIYMYNVNTAFKQYTKRLANTVLIKLGKRIVFPFNLNDLYAHINPAELELPKGTVSLETDNGVNISPVSRIFHMKSPMPTIIKITNEAIQITSLKKQEVCGMSSYFNDVYHISEVDDVTLITSPRHDETLVVVKFDRGNSSMTFSSPKYELIYKAIRSARNRFQLSKPAPISERVIRPNNVPGTLLNMALLNSGSDDPNLRLAAYNLLYALSLNFNFDVGNLLFNASGLCIPANNTNFIISISHKIAAVEPRFTLEFLTECFDGFRESSTPMKHLCLEYMAPWLPNLALFCRRGADHASSHYRHALAKTVDVIKVLVDLTVKESEMYPSVQAKIWRKIGRAEELLDVVLNFFVQYAVECGPFSRQAEVLGDTIVTLAAVNVRTAKLISRLRKLLVRTSINPARTLLEHPTWGEIAVLIRFSLMLMYNNPAAAQQYLPEIFFNLVMVIGIGPPSIRASVHGLVINVIQSLVASVTMNKADLKDLNSLVSQFSEPRFRLMFGLNQVSATAASVVGPGRVENDLPDATPLTSLEIIIQSLLSVLDCQTFPMDVANAWRARWMSLVTSTAFQYNIAIQPRAFVMLGCLASDEVDDDLLYQVLVTLRGALLAFDERDTNLVQSIVLCLTKLVDKLPEDSQFLPSLFWLALAILQIGQINLFTSALGLMDEILRSLDTQGVFTNRQPHKYLLSTRQPFEDTVAAIDGAQGVNFYTDFAFALATYLIKGLHHPTTKDTVLNVLHTFIGIHTNRENLSAAPRRITSQVLGAVVPLLPASAKNGELSELMWHLGLGDVHVDNPDVQDYYHQILDQFETPTETSAILLGSFLVAMLGLCEYEGEQLFLYRFLSEVATAFPGTFSLIYSSYLPKFNHALTSSQHVPTLEAIQSILIAVVRLPKPADGSSDKAPSHKDKLHELGFTGLLNCTTFDAMPPNTMKQNALLAATLVERIVS
ncbi:Ras GTPase activating protein ira2, partial [Dimargaris xerosporica]